MKKLFICILLTALILSSCRTVIKTEAIGEKPKNETILNKYYIDMNYDEDKKVGQAHEKIVFMNNEKTELKDIVLHIYPNAYKKLDTVPEIGNASKGYPDGFDPGYIDISNVKIDDKKANFKVSGMVLRINLNKPLKPGEKIDLDMDFALKVPVGQNRFGTYGGITQFVYWYPVLAVYDNGWQIRGYNKIGESNYSEIADYEVKITLNKDQIVASTGSIASEKKDKSKDNKTVLIKADAVRDFAWICSKDFNVEERIVDGIIIKNYYTSKNKSLGTKADEIAADVFNYYNELFGKYPYKEFDIVETYLYGGGMEYPQLISLGQGHYRMYNGLQHVIAHEIAHQWWYVSVGNDEYTYPWLDEGFAVYSTDMYTSSKSALKGALNTIVSKYSKAAGDIPAVNSPVKSFKNWGEYNTSVYRLGAAALHNLRADVGDEKFNSIMKAYYEGYKFKNADTDDFIEVVNKIAGKEAALKFRKGIN